jgi:hypothetical protein
VDLMWYRYIVVSVCLSVYLSLALFVYLSLSLNLSVSELCRLGQSRNRETGRTRGSHVVRKNSCVCLSISFANRDKAEIARQGGLVDLM